MDLGLSNPILAGQEMASGIACAFNSYVCSMPFAQYVAIIGIMMLIGAFVYIFIDIKRS